MVHLMVAKVIEPSGSLDFYIGNVAPDTVKDREQKRVTHLRNVPDRESALRELALRLNGNDYLKGILLHLFVDWKWDTTLMTDFAQQEGEGWHAEYFSEISLMAAYAYHHISWSSDLWAKMETCDDYSFVPTEYLTKEAIKRRIAEQHKWSMENDIGPSVAFPPELVDKFVNGSANEFRKWYSALSIAPCIE